jgi:hypothetical protein
LDVNTFLAGLCAHLVDEHGFVPALDAPGELPCKVARAHSSSTWPVAVFAEWISRCPEAREYLESKGLTIGPPAPHAPATLVQEQARAAQAGGQDYEYGHEHEVRALINGNMMPCLITGLIGGRVKVEAVDDRLRIAAVELRHVHPDDQGRARAVINKMHEAGQGLVQKQLHEELQQELQRLQNGNC